MVAKGCFLCFWETPPEKNDLKNKAKFQAGYSRPLMGLWTAQPSMLQALVLLAVMPGLVSAGAYAVQGQSPPSGCARLFGRVCRIHGGRRATLNTLSALACQ